MAYKDKDLSDLMEQLRAKQQQEVYPPLFDEDEDVLNGALCPSDIPDSVIYQHYEGYDFVPDDFFCSCGRY